MGVKFELFDNFIFLPNCIWKKQCFEMGESRPGWERKKESSQSNFARYWVSGFRYTWSFISVELGTVLVSSISFIVEMISCDVHI